MDNVKKEAINAAKKNLAEQFEQTQKDLSQLDSVEKQIFFLKELTKRTGILHEAQINQLKFWFVCLTNAVEFTISFDFDNSKIIYKVSKTDGPAPKNQNKNIDLLNDYVKVLLGSRYSVNIENLCQPKKKKARLLSQKKKR